MKLDKLAIEAAKAGVVGIVIPKLLENKVVGGYAAPAVMTLVAWYLSGQKGWKAAATAMGGYGLLNLVKQFAVKGTGGVLDAALPGNTNDGQGVFNLKIGKTASPGTNGIFGLGRARRRRSLGYIGADEAQMALGNLPASSMELEQSLGGY